MNRISTQALTAFRLLLSLALVACCTLAHASNLVKADIERMVDYFYIVGEPQPDLPVYPLFVKDPAAPEAKPELKAYVFETVDFAPSRGYSGKPINLLIIMDLAGNFLRVRLLDHKEPLFLDSAGTLKLERFASQYKGLTPRHNVEIGPYNDPGLRDEQIATVKGVQQGTISVKAINRAILHAAAAVATAKLKGGVEEQLSAPGTAAASSQPKESKDNRDIKTQAAAEDTKPAAVTARPANDKTDLGKDAQSAMPAEKKADDGTAATPLEKTSVTADTSVTEAPAPQSQTEDTQPTPQTLAVDEYDRQGWIDAWQARRAHIAILLIGLLILTIALILQKRLTATSLRLRLLRTLYLLFTVGFIGWTAQGQLTIVNITAALESLSSGGDLSFLMNDPMTVILWVFVGITLLVWGRGTFCGWLCPFGALQELLSLLTNALGLRQRRLRAALDARLKWIKYLILATLLVSLYAAPPVAELATEIEPFKTAISLYFMRDWPYVLWALGCLLLSVFVYRGYCRYICPLGAALASVNFLQRWSWIPRRDACGTPCQTCRHRCEYQAIATSGRVDYSECFQCLDCVSIYQDTQRCFPLIQLHKAGKTATSTPI